LKELFTLLTNSPEDTKEAGRRIGRALRPGVVLYLIGELGAGKTTLIKGIAQELAGIDPSCVTSPTFNYLNIYKGKAELHHFDLYRLSSSEEFIRSGFSEFLGGDRICCVEWPDRLPLSAHFEKWFVDIQYLEFEQRKITFRSPYAP